jgi:hypothetical protein
MQHSSVNGSTQSIVRGEGSGSMARRSRYQLGIRLSPPVSRSEPRWSLDFSVLARCTRADTCYIKPSRPLSWLSALHSRLPSVAPWLFGGASRRQGRRSFANERIPLKVEQWKHQHNGTLIFRLVMRVCYASEWGGLSISFPKPNDFSHLSVKRAVLAVTGQPPKFDSTFGLHCRPPTAMRYGSDALNQ